MLVQLARVADRAPLLVPLEPPSFALQPLRCVAVKVRPILLHVLIDSRVWCVVRSDVPINDVATYEPNKILVAVADGNLWVVTLPTQAQLGAGVLTAELVLEPTELDQNSQSDDGGRVQQLNQLPGVQTIECVPANSESPSFAVMTSLVTPTKVTSIDGTSAQPWSVELDEIEGEQSTCTLCLAAGDSRYDALLKRLFPELTDCVNAVAVLQGDLDGSVRYALIQYPSKQGKVEKASVIKSGVLLEIGQPIQNVIPFDDSVSSASPGVEDATSSPVFNAFVVLGTRGQLAVGNISDMDPSVKSFPVSWKKMDIGRAVQSMAFSRSLAAFLYCSSGSSYLIPSYKMVVIAVSSDSNATGVINGDLSTCTEKLPLPPGIVRLAICGNGQGISFLFSSGRIMNVDGKSICEMVSSKLFESEKQLKVTTQATSESAVRSLLRRITQISTESASLRSQSRLIDHQLQTLHSASEMLRFIERVGVESVFKCRLRATVVSCGNFLERQTVKLVCSLGILNPDAVLSCDNWSLCLFVRIRQQEVTTYSFPLLDPSTRTIDSERSIILDADDITLQDQGSVIVSCSLTFCHPDSSCQNEDPRTSPSFAIPLVQNRRFLLAQLSQPISDEVPATQQAMSSPFRQEHQPWMPTERVGNAKDDERTLSSAIWGGVQWWSALADHARNVLPFTPLWEKVALSDSTALLEVSPPQRFVMRIPHFFVDDDSDEDIDDDECGDKVRVERMVSFLRQLLDVPLKEIAQLRRSCRTQHGKLWLLLRNVTGNLVLLRLTSLDDGQRAVELSIQCSDVADLSAMRILVLEAIDEWKNGAARPIDQNDALNATGFDADDVLEPIATVESVLEDLTQKVKGINDPQTPVCTEEVLRALSELAYVETQTLSLYWKTRQIFNRTVV